MNIFEKIYKMYLRRINPLSYWVREGLIIKGNATLMQGCDFGTEPYLVEIGDHVRVNYGVKFVTHDGGAWVIRNLYNGYNDVDLFGKIVVKNNVHIGTDAIIMPGVTIGNNCIVGCGAIVTKDVPDNSIVAGIPAKIIETIDEYKTKHDNDFSHTKYMSKAKKKDYLLNRKEFIRGK